MNWEWPVLPQLDVQVERYKPHAEHAPRVRGVNCQHVVTTRRLRISPFELDEKVAISDGLMPLIRPAWPIESGRTRSKFLPGLGTKLWDRVIVEIGGNPFFLESDESGRPARAGGRCSRRTWPRSSPDRSRPAEGRLRRGRGRATADRSRSFRVGVGIGKACRRRSRVRGAGRASGRSRRGATRIAPSAHRRPDRRCRPSSVSRRSALSWRSINRYSARLVNMRYGSSTPRVTRSSISTPM